MREDAAKGEKALQPFPGGCSLALPSLKFLYMVTHLIELGLQGGDPPLPSCFLPLFFKFGLLANSFLFPFLQFTLPLFPHGFFLGFSFCENSFFGRDDFIGAITQHIPDKFFQNIRYYGWYSNKSRGQRKQAEGEAEGEVQKPSADEVIDVREHQPKRIPSKHWRELIKKVWETDPICCPKCQAEMKVVALIDCPNLIRHILEHLNLWEPVNKMIRPRAPPIQEMPEAHLSPGDSEQYALPLHRVEAMEGVDEIPPDDVPTIVYA